MLKTAIKALVVLEVTGEDSVLEEGSKVRGQRAQGRGPWKERRGLRIIGNVTKAKEGVSEVQDGTRQ